MSDRSTKDRQAPTVRRWQRTLPPLVLAIAAAIAGAWFATRSEPMVDADAATAKIDEQAAQLVALQATLTRSLVLPADFRTVPPFTLSDVDGEPLIETMLDGQWSLAFFGYTHCPDVCPVTLSVMKSVVAELEASSVDPMQVVFFTVDPVRDTAERMKEYVAFFDADFVGVTGEQNAIHELTRELGIVAAFTANETDANAYLVDHTASMLLIDPQRRVRAKFTAPHEVAPIVADYLAIRAALN